MSAVTIDRITSIFGRTSTAGEVAAGIDLSGQSAVVTGGASGIGIETVRALAGAGATVTIAARDPVLAQAVAHQINVEHERELVRTDMLDLADLSSVRAFAARWGDKPLSLLINNAGIMACPFGRTIDGFEVQLGTNHLGHFLLAVLLVPALMGGTSARVVSLSSSAHVYGAFNFDDPNYEERPYVSFEAYCESKTANALFAVEFHRRFQSQGISAVAVNPGAIRTNLGRHMTTEMRNGLNLDSDSAPDTLFYKSPAGGAATSVWAATARELQGRGGLYLEDCAQAMPYEKGLPRGTGVAAHALDPEMARRLWILSEAMVGIS